MNKNNSSKSFILFSLAASFVSLLFFSESSMLYPINSWVDTNCYFTVGRSIVNGLFPYINLYDQKGLIVHLIYTIAALISQKSFLGVFIIEVFCFSLFLYYSYKCINLYNKKTSMHYFAIAILSIVVPSSEAFQRGGSVEEISLFMYVLSLYLILKDLTQSNIPTNKTALIIGALSSVTFWMKYTLCGLYFGLIVFVIYLSIKNKLSLNRLVKLASFFILGFILVTVVVFVILIIKNALSAMFISYFYNNIFTYSDFSNRSILNCISGPIQSLIDNYPYSLFVLIGLICLLFNKNRRNETIVATLCILFFCLSTYSGGVYYSYYGLPFCCFSFFGFIDLDHCFERISLKKAEIAYYTLIVLFIINATVNNTSFKKIGQKKEELVQYKFASIMENDSNATLLNYYFLDGGFYFASGIIPNCQYYYKPNHLSYIKQEQDKYITEKKVKYVVTTGEKIQTKDYEIISSEEYDGINYLLYKLVND